MPLDLSASCKKTLTNLSSGHYIDCVQVPPERERDRPERPDGPHHRLQGGTSGSRPPTPGRRYVTRLKDVL